MKLKIPFKKDIKFSTRIAEITSISLEHELNIKSDQVLGDFIITGEYRSHEISVNRDHFLHRLPFSVDLTEEIDKDSVIFEIDDFTYDIKDDNKLSVNIEFIIEAEEIKREEIIEEKEEILPVLETRNTEKIEEPTLVEVAEDPLDLIECLEREEKENNIKKESIEERDDNTTVSQEMIVNETSNFEDTYTTYQVHIVRENETLESICEHYKTNLDLINKYNNISELSLNDKIIIPAFDE